MNASDPIRIFIGTEPKTRLAELVLRHSILKNTPFPVEFHSMDDSWPMPSKKYGTGFSLRRWMIPERCGFEGRAIYLDADMLVVADVSDLWSPASPELTPPVWVCYQKDKHDPSEPTIQTSVMVMNCSQCQDWRTENLWKKLDGTKPNYVSFMKGGWWDFTPGRLDPRWNDFNNYEPGKTKLVHYTKESTQPWYRPDHFFRAIWEEYLKDALDSGAVTARDVHEALEFIHPYWKRYAG